MRTYARLISVAFLSLGLMAGCATTEEGPGISAEQAIADAKAANAKAKAVGYEWRDTGKIIKKAEKALADGNDAEAIKQANIAIKQARDAVVQEKAENDRFMNSLSAEDRAALMGAESSMSKISGTSGTADSYSVVRGDNLWDISGKDSIYGNSYQWPLIYKANRNKIKDADLIYPGQVFDIDQNASSSEIDAAVRHARTRGAWSVGDVEQSDLDYLAR